MDSIHKNHFDKNQGTGTLDVFPHIARTLETSMMTASPLSAPVRRFSTDATPIPERAVLFQHEMQRLFAMSLAVRTSPPNPLSAQMLAYRGRRLHLAALKFSPHSTVSVPSGASTHSRLLVSLHKDGVAVVCQGGRENRIEPGDVFLIDPARPFSIETGDVTSHSVYLPTSAVRSLVPQLDDLTAVPIRGDGAAAVFRAAMTQVFASITTLQDDVADCLGEALPALLAAALIPCASARMPSRLRQLHKRRIMQFVHDHLCDPDLDADTIARGVCLSARHLYELFADEDEPLMKWVWSERLGRCARDLQTPALESRTIGEIAYRWGFNDVSHFSRAFKLRYTATPREWRKRADQDAVARRTSASAPPS
jgi:AraC family transcriptional activator of tynA and feaB